MGARIDQFCEDLRQKLTIADSGLDGLKAKINSKSVHVEQDVQSHLNRVHNRVEQGRARVAAAQADIRDWADEKKAATDDKISEWKAKRELSKLQGRAAKAERYAAAASAVAVAALDEAEEASLEAWLAREDANAAQAQ
jgi:predicted  nucleic acid-binding Zn-ribbon protein